MANARPPTFTDILMVSFYRTREWLYVSAWYVAGPVDECVMSFGSWQRADN